MTVSNYTDEEKNLHFLCKTLHTVTGISIFFLDSEFHAISCLSNWENQMKNFFFMNCPYDLASIADSVDTRPLYFSDSLHLNWMLITIPVRHSFLILGPVFETDITPAFFQKEMEFRKMSVSSQTHFLKMMNDIPVIPYLQFTKYISMIYYGIYGEILHIEQILRGISPKEDNLAVITNIVSKPVMNIPDSHGSRIPEKLMLEGVRTGNISLSSQFKDPSPTIVGTLSNGDPLRQVKNSIISQITLVTRAAVEGGMDAETAYSLSDFYIQKIELCQLIDDVYALSTEMYRTFVEQVHKIRTLGYRPIVVYMCSYIDQHIFEPISLDEIADKLGYDAYYLTTLFKKDTGMTMKAYILGQKIEQAKIFLSTTRMEMQEISDCLSFKSPSYFCTQFKKITGESPLSYRKNVPTPVTY